MASSPALHDRSTAPNESQRQTPRRASGSSTPDQSTGDPWTNNEVPVRCEARTDREQHRSSAPDDLREPRRQGDTRRTVDLGHSSDGPIMDRPRRHSRQQHGIKVRRLSQPTSATKSAKNHIPQFNFLAHWQVGARAEPWRVLSLRYGGGGNVLREGDEVFRTYRDSGCGSSQPAAIFDHRP